MDYINMWMEWGEFVCLGSLKNFYENMYFFFFFFFLCVFRQSNGLYKQVFVNIVLRLFCLESLDYI